MGPLLLIAMGLAGAGLGAHALFTGEVTIVWSRLAGGWMTLKSEASRDEDPVLYWGGTVFYIVVGLALAGFGVYRMMLTRGH